MGGYKFTKTGESQAVAPVTGHFPADANRLWLKLMLSACGGVYVLYVYHRQRLKSDVDCGHASRVVEALARKGENSIERILDLRRGLRDGPDDLAGNLYGRAFPWLAWRFAPGTGNGLC